nr:BPK_HP1_G0042880.mRNA.1.CDS.1 [Saccharomyces cerevisiae]
MSKSLKLKLLISSLRSHARFIGRFSAQIMFFFLGSLNSPPPAALYQQPHCFVAPWRLKPRWKLDYPAQVPSTVSLDLSLCFPNYTPNYLARDAD